MNETGTVDSAADRGGRLLACCGRQWGARRSLGGAGSAALAGCAGSAAVRCGGSGRCMAAAAGYRRSGITGQKNANPSVKEGLAFFINSSVIFWMKSAKKAIDLPKSRDCGKIFPQLSKKAPSGLDRTKKQEYN